MIARFGPMSGYISQLVLGFGVGGGSIGSQGAAAGLGKLDFSRSANSDLIVALRRF